MEDEEVTLSHVEQVGLASYLGWLSNAQTDGIPRKTILKYYSADSPYFYRVTINGVTHIFPIFTNQTWLQLDGGLDEYLGMASSTRGRDHDPEMIKRLAREVYVRRFKPSIPEGEYESFRLGDVISNDEVFCIASDYSGAATFQVKRTDWYSYVSHEAGLAREFYDALWREDITNPETDDLDAVFARLDKRNADASTLAEVTHWGTHSQHCIGPVCQLAIRRPDNTHELYYAQQPHDIVTAPGLHGVVPTTLLHGDPSNISMEQAVIDKIASELSGTTDHAAEDVRTGELSRQVIESRLRQALTEDQLAITRTSFGVGAYETNPVMGGLIYVVDPELGQWLRTRLESHWEAGRLKRVRLPESGIPTGMHPDAASPSGALAFYEGLRTLRDTFDVNIGVEITVNSPVGSP